MTIEYKQPKTMSQLESENAKLRELVADMFSDMVNMDFALKLQGRTFMVVTRYEPRLHELGVEVDDGTE